MIDLPIMGYDDSSEQLALASAGYCKTGDIPTIKIHGSDGSVTTMMVEVKSVVGHSLAQQEEDMLWLH